MNTTKVRNEERKKQRSEEIKKMIQIDRYISNANFTFTYSNWFAYKKKTLANPPSFAFLSKYVVIMNRREEKKNEIQRTRGS